MLLSHPTLPSRRTGGFDDSDAQATKERPEGTRAQVCRLPGNRLHLQDGPIDLVIAARGSADEIEAAYTQAHARFIGLLDELVVELNDLRRPLGDLPPRLRGSVAQRMAAAAWPYRALWVTPMAAVAGAVAEAVLEAMLSGRRLRKAWVNNGGDIAFHLAPDEDMRLGLVLSIEHGLPEGLAEVRADQGLRGVATSGRGGRSLSRGLADAVTVLAPRAADADVAATLIANAVDIDHPAVFRRPACELDPDSDLGSLPVVVAVAALPREAVTQAIEAGAKLARDMIARGRIGAAVIALAGQRRVIHSEHHLLQDPACQTS